jgi:hypothetical protein
MRRYSFEEIEKLHKVTDGKIHAFNRDYQGKYFIKKTVQMNKVIQVSIIKPEVFERFPLNNKDRITIEALINAYKNQSNVPPVILKMLEDGSYDIIDGLHRLSAMNSLEIVDFEAFVLV